TGRRALLQSPAPAVKKYAWPKWDETFEDPVSGRFWTFRQIVQGLIDNMLGRDSEWRWRLNDEVPIPADAHPLTNPGLELTGPWHTLDMAFNALNSPAPMNMPDFEDASPSHFRPDGARPHPHHGPLHAQHLRGPHPRGHRRILLHPEDPDPPGSPHCGEAPGAAGRHDRRPARHDQDQSPLRGGQCGPILARDRL